MREAIGSGKEKRRHARKILAEREAEAVLGKHRIAPSQTPRFGEFADDWLARKEPGLRPKTRESYRGMINLHLRPAFGEMRLAAISRQDIETFVASLPEARSRRGKRPERPTLSVVTVNYALRILKGILQNAADLGRISENVAARVKRLRAPDGDGKDAMRFLTPEEIGRLLDATEEPWRSLYQVAFHTGLRRGELLGLRWRDVDIDAAVVHVHRSLGRIKDGDSYVVREAPVKTKASRRMVDLSPAIVQTFLAIQAGDDPDRDYVFRSRTGGYIDPDNVDRALKRHLTLAKLPEAIRLHDLRHTYASLLIAAGAHPKYIQVQMGHTSITVTMDRYGHLMRSGFERVGAQLDAVVQGTNKAQNVSSQRRLSETATSESRATAG